VCLCYEGNNVGIGTNNPDKALEINSINLSKTKYQTREKAEKDFQGREAMASEIIGKRDAVIKDRDRIAKAVEILLQKKREVEKGLAESLRKANNIDNFIKDRTKDVEKSARKAAKEHKEIAKREAGLSKRELELNEKESKIRKAYRKGGKALDEKMKLVEELDNLIPKGFFGTKSKKKYIRVYRH